MTSASKHSDVMAVSPTRLPTWIGWPAVDVQPGERLSADDEIYEMAPVVLSENELILENFGLPDVMALLELLSQLTELWVGRKVTHNQFGLHELVPIFDMWTPKGWSRQYSSDRMSRAGRLAAYAMLRSWQNNQRVSGHTSILTLSIQIRLKYPIYFCR